MYSGSSFYKEEFNTVFFFLSGGFQATSKAPKMAAAKRIITMTEARCVSPHTDLCWLAGALGLGFGDGDKLRYQGTGGKEAFISFTSHNQRYGGPPPPQSKWT